MSIDKFGRFLNQLHTTSGSGGKEYSHRQDLTFSLTTEGNLNFNNKRLTNIGFPQTANDAVTKKYVDDKSEDTNQQVQKDLRTIRDSVAIVINKIEQEAHRLDQRITHLEHLQVIKNNEAKTNIENTLKTLKQELERTENKTSLEINLLKEQMSYFINKQAN